MYEHCTLNRLYIYILIQIYKQYLQQYNTKNTIFRDVEVANVEDVIHGILYIVG